jgi:hypothetical protein
MFAKHFAPVSEQEKSAALELLLRFQLQWLTTREVTGTASQRGLSFITRSSWPGASAVCFR